MADKVADEKAARTTEDQKVDMAVEAGEKAIDQLVALQERNAELGREKAALEMRLTVFDAHIDDGATRRTARMEKLDRMIAKARKVGLVAIALLMLGGFGFVALQEARSPDLYARGESGGLGFLISSPA